MDKCYVVFDFLNKRIFASDRPGGLGYGLSVPFEGSLYEARDRLCSRMQTDLAGIVLQNAAATRRSDGRWTVTMTPEAEIALGRLVTSLTPSDAARANCASMFAARMLRGYASFFLTPQRAAQKAADVYRVHVSDVLVGLSVRAIGGAAHA
ncbi:MAG: hypothetical protein HUK26_07320 [Duodenibacillus sp.]|nr:hypothetical protein [Duodenibacillus sp.]